MVTGRPLGAFSREPWTADGTADPTANDFTVIEFRLNSEGQGQGTMSLATPITVDTDAGIVALDGVTSAPVLFETVTREPKPYWARES